MEALAHATAVYAPSPFFKQQFVDYDEAEHWSQQFQQQIDIYCPEQLEPNEDKVRHILRFMEIDPNWDGEGATPPEEATILNAIDFFQNLPIQYQNEIEIQEIDITPYGTITFDWIKNSDSRISIEIGKSQIGFFSRTSDQQNPTLLPTTLTFDAIDEKVLPVLNKIFSLA